jgi:putative aldouronate transport system substrate-binding protein
MRKKSLGAVLFAKLGLLLLLVIAAPNASGGSAREESELITLDAYTQLANTSGYQPGWYAALLEDLFNVRLNIISDTEGVYETRVESGDLGDIVVWGSNGFEYKNAVALGLLFDWEEDALCETYGPNIWENAQNALETNREISGDGHVYGVGHAIARSSENHQSFFYTWDIRWDLYARLGYPEVTDLDSYVDLMVQMKEINPVDIQGNEAYAVSLWPDWDGTMVMYPKAFATAYYGYDEMVIGVYDCETGRLHGALERGGPYLTALRFFNQLYQNGLVDPDSATQTFDQMSERLRNGGVFFSIFNFSGSDGFNSQENMDAGMMMLPLAPSEARPPTYGMSVLGGNRIWSIGSESSHPELCMEILNYLFSPDGAMTIWYGLPGLHWYYDEDGYTHFTELGQICKDDSNYDLGGVEWVSPYTGNSYLLGASFVDGMLAINNLTWARDAGNPNSNGETFNSDFWRSQQRPPVNEIEADWREVTGALNEQEYMENTDYVVIPGTSYSESIRSDELEVTWRQVTTAIKNFSWRAIYAETDAEFDRIVETMIRLCNEYGYEDVLEWSENEAEIRRQLELELRETEGSR